MLNGIWEGGTRKQNGHWQSGGKVEKLTPLYWTYMYGSSNNGFSEVNGIQHNWNNEIIPYEDYIISICTIYNNSGNPYNKQADIYATLDNVYYNICNKEGNPLATYKFITTANDYANVDSFTSATTPTTITNWNINNSTLSLFSQTLIPETGGNCRYELLTRYKMNSTTISIGEIITFTRTGGETAYIKLIKQGNPANSTLSSQQIEKGYYTVNFGNCVAIATLPNKIQFYNRTGGKIGNV